MNLELKVIKPRPRTIFKSDKVRAKRLPAEYIQSLALIEHKIEAGIDITRHQSKKVFDPLYNDLLLNEWIIQHIHLSKTKSQKGQRFYDRSKYLLFAMFNETQAFFIDIREHKEEHLFAKKEFLEIVLNNWPSLLTPYLGEDVTYREYSDADIDILRRKGYALGATVINGKSIINPGIGVTCSGHNMLVVGKANDIVRYLHESSEEIEKNVAEIKEALSEEVGFGISELDICLHRLEQWPYFAFYENQSQRYLEKNYANESIKE
jgi:hypothetical protein